MGVFVKGMYLPPNCYFCPMTNDGFYLCKANNPHKQLEDDCEERRPNWCPLIEVPEPHGRLIDADVVERNLLKMQQAQTGQYSHGVRKSRAVLRDAPTIIQASNELLN